MFALSQAVDNKTKRDTTINFCCLANELHWTEQRKRSGSNNNFDTGLPKFHYKDEITLRPKYPDFERKLARINV